MKEKEKVYRGLAPLAARLGVSIASASRLVTGGQIAHRRVGPSRKLIEVSEADARDYLERGYVAAKAA
jgi:hypothetical protein